MQLVCSIPTKSYICFSNVIQ